ncbi:MAG TPA: prepilin-type N-terminal cleavage/methylation domain-containing protein [Patescibacteria group bacterium]|nr:prepilin-type N-terminal cleavage/methylation domain-containing protein [Patescibacteria group bacterium]
MRNNPETVEKVSYCSNPSRVRTNNPKVLGLPRTINKLGAIADVFQRSRYRAGFGLVEVLVAITIVMIVLGGTGALVTQSINASGDAREKIVAEGLAQDLIEKARNNRDLNKVLNDSGNGFSLAEQTLNNIVYKKKYESSSVAVTGGSPIPEITVTISWYSSSTHNNRRDYTLTTILSD